MPVAADAGAPGQLGAQIDAGIREDLAQVASEAANPGWHGLISSYLLTSAPTQALLAATTSQRSLVYILAAHHGGAALRVSSVGEPPVTSIELPHLTLSAVQGLLSRIRALSHDPGLRTRRLRAAHLDAVLDDVGAMVWAPLVDAWPALLSEPIAVVPVGETAVLPLFTARTDTIPVCAHADLTLIPSARALFLAGELQPSPAGTALVAADPSPALNPIPHTIDEALGVAGVYRTQPLIFSTTHRAPSTHQQATNASSVELAEWLGSASLIHLACHGKVAAGDPLDSVLLIGGEIRLRQLLEQTLTAGALVVLSACELASIGLDHPNEQLGFPAAVLASGARSVVGALWPVPDHPDTIRLMINFHLCLQTTSSSTALAQAIATAHRAGVPSTVWAPFTHIGAASDQCLELVGPGRPVPPGGPR